MGIYCKVKGFDDGRSETTSAPKPEGVAANSPGSSGFRLADTHFARRHRPIASRGSSRHSGNRIPSGRPLL
ncbi:hypothetical protein MES5069_410025 [Mesorhizobium escarrei]|uniref:Propionyl-coenzyme A carboxylase alpha polypeptide n=1 Tax=Mesorhizobium escarrei TaxID=666018 RepID=A0ABM9E6G5_9HYPH|nr:hypothetical protein MES5069_410025 [Mesorhizobium escarrei]